MKEHVGVRFSESGSRLTLRLRRRGTVLSALSFPWLLKFAENLPDFYVGDLDAVRHASC